MMKFRYLPVAGALLASLTIAACDSGNGGHSAGAGSPVPALTPTVPASTPTVSATGPAVADTESAAPSASASASASTSPDPGYVKARAAWIRSSHVGLGVMYIYENKAADDLRASHRASYKAAIDELEYLATIPGTDVTNQQQVKGRADVRALDAFFGTPGLNQ